MWPHRADSMLPACKTATTGPARINQWTCSTPHQQAMAPARCTIATAMHSSAARSTGAQSLCHRCSCALCWCPIAAPSPPLHTLWRPLAAPLKPLHTLPAPTRCAIATAAHFTSAHSLRYCCALYQLPIIIGTLFKPGLGTCPLQLASAAH